MRALHCIFLVLVTLIFAACSTPTKLTSNQYGSQKYNLPPLLASGASVSVSLTPGQDTWLYVPVSSGGIYSITATGATSGSMLTVYHADKTTPLLNAVNVSTNPVFQATANENAFVKVDLPSGAAATTLTLNCVSYQALSSSNSVAGVVTPQSSFFCAIPVVAGHVYQIASSNYSVGIGLYQTDRTTVVTTISNSYTNLNDLVYVAKSSTLLFLEVVCGPNDLTDNFMLTSSDQTLTALTSGGWQNGTIASGQTLWYSFAVTAGTTYSFSINSLSEGDGTQTGGISANIYKGDLSTTYLSDVIFAFNVPETFTATATETIYISVSFYSTPGTFSIKIDPPTPPTALTSGTVQQSSIGIYQALWYTFNVSAGVPYNILVDSGGTDTAVVRLYVYHADKTTSVSLLSQGSKTTTFFSTVAETLYIKVSASASGSFTLLAEPNTLTALTAGTWRNDTISLTPLWYTFNVVAGTSYDFKLNSASGGDGTKTGTVQATIFRPDGTTYVQNETSGSTSFIAKASEAICIEISEYFSAGTFAVEVQPTPFSTLTLNTWQNGSFSWSTTTEWYTFSATAGTLYNLFIDDEYNTSTMSTVVSVNIYHSDKATPIGNTIWNSSLSNYPFTFATQSAETIYVAVNFYSGSTNGNYAFDVQPLAGVSSLTAGTWTSGILPAAKAESWFEFNGIAGTTYTITWNDAIDGDKTYTGSVKVSAFHGDAATSYFSNATAGYTTPQAFTATATEPVYILVTGATTSSTGTFAIQYH